MSEELKPCPMCGGKPVFRNESLDERCGYGYVITVACPDCRLQLATGNKSDKAGWNNEPADQQRDRAIAAWNRRAEP